MTPRALLALFLAVLACAAGLPAAQAQGLKASPQLGISSGAASARAPAGSSGSSNVQRQADFIVAVVNSEPITNNEVRARLVRVEQQLAQRGQPMPPREELARQVLERLVSERAQLQMAREGGIKVDEPTVDQAERNVARQNQLDVPELRRRLAQDGIPLAQFRDDLRNQIMLARLRDREVEPRVQVSDLEVDQYVREQMQDQKNADPGAMALNLGHVLIRVPEDASEAQVASLRARADQVAARARAGEDFAALAREFSDSPEGKRNGGQLGLREADRYPTLFVEAVQKLPEGGIAGPVRSGAGFHILKVLQRQQAGLAGVHVTQSHARHILLRLSPQLTESAAVERLAGFKKRIEAGQADFAALAREYSQDGSAREGGDLGWVSPGTFVPEFEEVMNNLQPGQISAPLVSRFGVHLIQLLERRDATLSDREQREIARAQLREKKLDEAYNDWARDVRGRAYVEYRDPPQ